MGGGGQFPYPKEVWTPTGGWWTRPKNWKANTAVIASGMSVIVYMTWQFSASREQFSRKPDQWIPSLHFTKQLSGPEYDHLREKAPFPFSLLPVKRQ